MQDLIRAIIERAPNWGIGLACVAAIRLAISLFLTDLQLRSTTDALRWNERNRGRKLEPEALGEVFGPLKKLRNGLLLSALSLGLSVWMLVSVWAVVVDGAPDSLRASVWWAGTLLALLECGLPYVRWRRRRPPVQIVRVVNKVLFVLTIGLTWVYARAPLGVLIYLGVVVVGNVFVSRHLQELRDLLAQDAPRDA